MAIIAPINLLADVRGLHPTGTSPSLTTAAYARLSWGFDYTGITGTVTFRVQVDDGALSYSDVGTTTNVVLTAMGLPIHALRNFRVRAEHGTLGNSAWLVLGPILTSDDIPSTGAAIPPLIDFRVALLTTSSVQVTWRFGSANTSVVQVYVLSETGAVVSTDASAVNGAASTTISGLTPGASYTFSGTTRALIGAGTVINNVTSDSTAFAFARMLLPDDATAIVGPTTLYVEQGAPIAAQWSFQGLGAVEAWSIIGAPGLSLTALGADKRLARLTGAATEDGIYQATVYCLRSIGLLQATFRFPVRLVIGPPGLGGSLEWLHDDPTRVDLQVSGRDVYSWASPVSEGDRNASLRLVRGDTQRLYLVPRDAGGNLLTGTVSKLGLTVRLKDHLDGMPFVALYFDAPPTETLAGHTVSYLDAKPSGPILEQIFTRLDSAPGAEPDARELECEGEITLQIGSGNPRTAGPFRVVIVQDSDR